ncbi:MAG TPA: alpha-2-macroglobulin family protein, partial [Roseiflexaceae bacterium]|nr:alpha-2-macroglobulin family protein [Roseiflexaceae bacterium]
GSSGIGAEPRDDRGRLIASDSYIWATGDTVFWGVDDTNRIDLIADRTSYAPGDTARVLVTAPYPGMTALITIERGTVVEHRLHTLQGTSELIDIPISAAYTPNVYVGLTLIKPPGNREGDPSVPELRVGLVNLPVTTRERELTVTLTPDRSEYGPRDRVTYTIRTSDHSGAGVRSEVSLALVDKAILTLAADPNPSLIAAFFERRPLGVLQANLLTILVDRVTLRLQEGDKGGGGAAIDGDLRSDFPDTAFWQADLITNERGEAQITIDLPDTLTTWRMTARAVTTDTRVGEAVADIVASRPLLLRPTLPRVLSAGDQPRIQAVVQNTTGSDLNATVRIEASAPIGIQGNTTQQVTVPAGGTTLVHWQASVAEQAGTATISIRAEAGALRDAITQSIQVQRYVTEEASASAGQVIDQVVETIILSPASAAHGGELTLELAPSLAAGVGDGLEQLSAHPYDGAEQSVGTFIAHAALIGAYRDTGISDPALVRSFEQNLTHGLQRLYAATGPLGQLLRNTGVHWFNRSGPLKRQIMAEAMGLGALH